MTQLAETIWDQFRPEGYEWQWALVEFLRARIAEDEATAQAAGAEPWYHAEVPGMTMRKPNDEIKIIIDSPATLVSYEVVNEPMAQHIADHNPAYVLADCEAKRRIIERASRPCVRLEWPDTGPFGPVTWIARDGTLTGVNEDGQDITARYNEWAKAVGVPRDLTTLRLLAAPHAGHPDFREEWRA